MPRASVGTEQHDHTGVEHPAGLPVGYSLQGESAKLKNRQDARVPLEVGRVVFLHKVLTRRGPRGFLGARMPWFSVWVPIA